MEIVEIKTLIDITKTGAQRPNQGSQTEIDQNRNFTTLMQCIEIRSIVTYDQKPRVEKVDLKGLDFGSNFKGKHQVWTFTVRTDRGGVYLDDQGNPVGQLIEDLHNVPVIKNLTETINIDKAMFDCKSLDSKNTSIRILSSVE